MKVPTAYICFLRSVEGAVQLHQLYMNPGRSGGTTLPGVEVILERYGGEWRPVPTVALPEKAKHVRSPYWWERAWVQLFGKKGYKS